MLDEDGYITLNVKNRKPALTSAVTEQNYQQVENKNASGTLHQLAKKFCQYLIKQLEQKNIVSKYGIHEVQDWINSLGWIVTQEP
uniref:C-type lectin domain family 1 member B n=1 Tax=Ursus americanus TaxID=9643 RepID=A0A452SDR7_URSAM